jgi:hypothetical protein
VPDRAIARDPWEDDEIDDDGERDAGGDPDDALPAQDAASVGRGVAVASLSPR